MDRVYRTRGIQQWVPLVGLAAFAVFGIAFVIHDPAPGFMWVWLGFVVFAGFTSVYRVAYDVRVTDESVCVFRTRLRRVSVPAAQLRSIRGRTNAITFRWDGGKMYVQQPLDGLVELVTRLRELNPGIETRGI